MYIYIRTYVHCHTYMRTYVCKKYTHTYIRIHTYILTYIHTYLHMHVRICEYVYIINNYVLTYREDYKSLTSDTFKSMWLNIQHFITMCEITA